LGGRRRPRRPRLTVVPGGGDHHPALSQALDSEFEECARKLESKYSELWGPRAWSMGGWPRCWPLHHGFREAVRVYQKLTAGDGDLLLLIARERYVHDVIAVQVREIHRMCDKGHRELHAEAEAPEWAPDKPPCPACPPRERGRGRQCPRGGDSVSPAGRCPTSTRTTLRRWSRNRRTVACPVARLLRVYVAGDVAPVQ